MIREFKPEDFEPHPIDPKMLDAVILERVHMPTEIWLSGMNYPNRAAEVFPIS